MQIRKHLLQLSAILLLLSSLLESLPAQGLYWGPRGGLNISTVTKTTYAKARSRASFGLMAGYKINDLIGLQAEALYSLQGSKMTNSDQIHSYNYVKIPLLAKLYLIGGLNIEAGISFNWLVKAQREWSASTTDANGITTTLRRTENLLSNSKTFDFTVPVGINYQFSRLIDIGLRYDISTLRVPEDKDNRAKSSNWSLSLGLRF